MGIKTGVEWADHTFNPWWGCDKVSPACANCYAETWAKRTGHDLWGPLAPRRFFGDKHWAEPLKWDRDAAEAGRPALVFCASMADVFEERDDLDPHRERLWELVTRTPNLIWLLLTKRPIGFSTLTPAAWRREGGWPLNVWAGCTVEDQKRADERLPLLVEVPAPVRFISVEPMLSDIQIRGYLGNTDDEGNPQRGIGWVIGGGESGSKARGTKPEWVRQLAHDCQVTGAAWFWKQWGEFVPPSEMTDDAYVEWDARENGAGNPSHDVPVRIGKKAAGRLLDGVEWNEYPKEAGRG